MTTPSLRLLVVDDSALYRQLVQNVLREIAGVEVVGVAKSGQEALESIGEHNPDLITLDVQMPDLNGIEVLRELKRRRSATRAIMLSSLTANGAQITTDALLEGAFDFIHKPNSADAGANRRRLAEELTEKIHAFRQTTRVRKPPPASSAGSSVVWRAASASDTGAPQPEFTGPRCKAVVIGTSTGGPVALAELLPALPASLSAALLIVQHMPPQYTQSLAKRLNERSLIEVVEGAEGMPVAPGFAYIAPGGSHMRVEPRGSRMFIAISSDPPENSCRPSVDYLFRSAAEVYRSGLVGVVLTGMGRDGAAGCAAIKSKGGYVLTQDAEGCAVYGMPKAVVDDQLADESLPLSRIAGALVRRTGPPSKRS